MAISEIAAKFNIPETRVKTYINVFKNLPEEFRKMVGSSSGGSPKKGKITPTVINEIMNNRCFTKAQQQILFKRVQKDDISQQQIRLIKELKNAGMLFDEALQEYKNYKMYRCSVPLHIEETDKFMKKNKITTQFRLILHLVSGAVHGQSNLLGHKIKKELLKEADGYQKWADECQKEAAYWQKRVDYCQKIVDELKKQAEEMQ